MKPCYSTMFTVPIYAAIFSGSFRFFHLARHTNYLIIKRVLGTNGSSKQTVFDKNYAEQYPYDVCSAERCPSSIGVGHFWDDGCHRVEILVRVADWIYKIKIECGFVNLIKLEMSKLGSRFGNGLKWNGGKCLFSVMAQGYRTVIYRK